MTQAPERPPALRRSGHLPLETVEAILLASWSLNDADLGRIHNTSADTIRRIRQGHTHANIRPDLPRMVKRTCSSCRFNDPRRTVVHSETAGRTINLHGTCTMGVPERRLHGARAALVCSCFWPEA